MKGEINTAFLEDCKTRIIPTVGIAISLDRLLMLIQGIPLSRLYR
jgi:elongation factor P--beta-lysine ligase